MSKKLILKSLRLITWGLFILYLLVLIYVIILKDGTALTMAEHGTQIPFSKKITQINITPLVNTIIPYLKGEPSVNIAMRNLLGNTIVFSPLGFLLPLLFETCKRFKVTFSLSLGVSLFIEIVQLIFYLGSCDIDDLILNVLGMEYIAYLKVFITGKLKLFLNSQIRRINEEEIKFMSIWIVISVVLALLVVSVLCLILGIVKRNKKLILFSLVFLVAILAYAILLYLAIMSFSSGPQIPR